MVVPESQLDGSMTISMISFEKSPAAGNSVLLDNLTISLGEAGGEELGNQFGGNLVEDSPLEIVFSVSRVTASADSEGRINFTLDTPYEYTGGNLLIDLSYSNISGSMYTWGWSPDQYRFLAGEGSRATQGNVSPLVPVIVITGE